MTAVDDLIALAEAAVRDDTGSEPDYQWERSARALMPSLIGVIRVSELARHEASEWQTVRRDLSGVATETLALLQGRIVDLTLEKFVAEDALRDERTKLEAAVALIARAEEAAKFAHRQWDADKCESAKFAHTLRAIWEPLETYRKEREGAWGKIG